MIERLRWFGQSSILFLDGKIIYIDPWEIPNDQPKADLILITHTHFDHCSPEDVKALAKPETVVVGPPDCLEHVGYGAKGLKAAPGEKILPLGFNIHVVPAYNLKAERLNFHPKSNHWVGYILEVSGTKYYHAGDTDEIPEMKEITTDVAFLPIGGTYTMDVYEAVSAAKTIKPKLVCPMHYAKVPGVGSEGDGEKFVLECSKAGLKAEVLKRYSRV